MKTNKKEQKSKKDEKAPMDAAMTCRVEGRNGGARGASDRTYVGIPIPTGDLEPATFERTYHIEHTSS